MKLTQYITATAALLGAASARPSKRRVGDADILNYALTLEHLEDAFYREGIAKLGKDAFTAAGYSQTFYENLLEVSYDETTHVGFLTSALEAIGAPAVKECKYNFGITDVKTFLTIASVLEGVGVTAYLGAAGFIADKTYLTAAGSILTVEARHSAYLRAAGVAQRPFPQAFDVPLTFNEVYTLAAPFIVECPSDNPKFLNLAAFPTLKVTSDPVVLTGSKLTVSYETKSKRGITVNVHRKGKKEPAPEDHVFAAFITVTGPVWAEITPGSGGYTVTVPAGIHGQSYLVLTKSEDSASDDNIIAGPAIVEISGTDGFPALV